MKRLMTAELDAALARLEDPSSPRLPPDLKEVYTANSKLFTQEAIRMHYAGHVLECAAVLLDGDDLVQDHIVRIVKAVDTSSAHQYCSNSLALRYDHHMYCYGAACHAAAGLSRWRQQLPKIYLCGDR